MVCKGEKAGQSLRGTREEQECRRRQYGGQGASTDRRGERSVVFCPFALRPFVKLFCNVFERFFDAFVVHLEDEVNGNGDSEDMVGHGRARQAETTAERDKHRNSSDR